MRSRRSLWIPAAVAVISVAVIAVLAWPRSGGAEAYEALRPSAPRDVALAGSTLTWQPPESSPAPLTSYSVLYRPADQPDAQWSVYARDSLATTVDVSGATPPACADANPDWSCVFTGGDLDAGTTYALRVIARTADALGYMSADVEITPL